VGERRTVPPKRTNFVLATDIPNGERDVLVFDRLDVEACIGSSAVATGVRLKDGLRTDGWDCRDNLTELQFVQDGGLACCVEADLYRTLDDVPGTCCGTLEPTISIPGRRYEQISVKNDWLWNRGYLRISLLPKRPESKREMLRPMDAGEEKMRVRGNGVS
jgi:hypothetical protein